MPSRRIVAGILLLIACEVCADASAITDLKWLTSEARSDRIYRDTDPSGQKIRIGDRVYDRGVVAYAPVRIVVALDGTYRSFTAAVGVEASSAPDAGASFEVFVDGERRVRSRMIRHGRPAANIAIDVTGGKQLELVAHEYIRHKHRKTWAAWTDAKLSTDPTPKMDDPRLYRDRSVQQKLFFDTIIEDRPDRRPYLLSLPRPLEELKRQGTRYPMLVFLHGIVEGGDDHRNLFVEAIPEYLIDRPAYVKRYPFVFLCPQAPWKTSFQREDVAAFVIDLVEHVRDAYPVDPDRIYLTGLSDGGIGTWAIAQRRPGLFAAIAPIGARAVNPAAAGRTLRNVPAWIMVGAGDTRRIAGSRQMHNSYRRADATSRLQIVPGFRHVIWDQAYLDPKLYDWLLQWKRGGRRDPFTGLIDAGDPPDQVAAAKQLQHAERLRDAGRIVPAYHAYQQIVFEHTDTLAAQLAEVRMAAMQRNAQAAAQIAEAADERSADQMLRIARTYARDHRADLAHTTYQLIVDTWPLTKAARAAKAELQPQP
jgi:pimeloyl-ACP methyl ester carboxylesterase